MRGTVQTQLARVTCPRDRRRTPKPCGFTEM